jgi:hypothetical protein
MTHFRYLIYLLFRMGVKLRHNKEITQIEGVWEHVAEENI